MKEALKVIVLFALAVSCRQKDVTPECLFKKACQMQSYQLGSNVFTYKYDGDNVLKEITLVPDSNPERLFRTLEFNGCLLQKSSFDATKYTTYQYDELGRLIKVDHYGFELPFQNQSGWGSGYRIQYDGRSNKPKKIISYSTPRSIFGMVLAEIITMDNGFKAQKNGECDYEYDANGNVSKRHTYIIDKDPAHTKLLVRIDTYIYDDKTNNLGVLYYLTFGIDTIPYGFSKNNLIGVKSVNYYSGVETAEPDLVSQIRYDNSGNITMLNRPYVGTMENIVWKCQ